MCMHVEEAPQRNNAREEEPRQRRTTASDVYDVDASCRQHRSLASRCPHKRSSTIQPYPDTEVQGSQVSEFLVQDAFIGLHYSLYLSYFSWTLLSMEREGGSTDMHAILRKDADDMTVVMYVSHVACHILYHICVHLSLFPLTSPLVSCRVILNRVEDDEDDDAFLPPSPLSLRSQHEP